MASSVQPRTSAPTARRAWIWLATTPVFVVVGMFAGYAVQGIVGIETTGEERSLLLDGVVGIILLAVWLIPCALARSAAQSALMAGDRGGRVPSAAALALAVVMVLFVVGVIGGNLLGLGG